jgi:hypothetical protein
MGGQQRSAFRLSSSMRVTTYTPCVFIHFCANKYSANKNKFRMQDMGAVWPLRSRSLRCIEGYQIQ